MYKIFLFSKTCQYLCSEFSKKNTGKSVYLEAMVTESELTQLAWKKSHLVCV